MNISLPKISVILPVYNAEKYLSEAIESILNQTFADFEFIIIDDGSTDASYKIINEYSDNRIKLFQNESNKGLIYTLNRGIELAKGKYLARMDADDVALPMRFAKQIEYMDSHSECIVCGTEIMQVRDGRKRWYLPRIYEYTDQSIKNSLLVSSCFAHPTVMIRRKVLIDNNIRYNYEYKCAEDYKLWIDLSEFGAYHNLKERLLNYRITKTQVTHSDSTKNIVAKTSQKCRREYINFIFKSEPVIINILNNNRFSFKTIKLIKKLVINKELRKYICYDMYCSLTEFSIIDLLYYFFSFDFLKYDIVTTYYIIKSYFDKSNRLNLL